MKRFALLALGALMLGLPTTAPIVFAQTATTAAAALTEVSFDVPDMTCALCPVTVKRAMEGVDGVRTVEIDFEARMATVVFDTATTSADAIATASANAGYPARVAG